MSEWATSNWPVPAPRLVLWGLPSRIGHLLDIPLRELEKFSISNYHIVIADQRKLLELGLPLKEKNSDDRYRYQLPGIPRQND